MRYKASITNWCLCVALSIIVLHVICSFMNLSMRTKQTETQYCKHKVKRYMRCIRPMMCSCSGNKMFYVFFRLWTWSIMLEGIIEMQSLCETKAIQNKELRITLKTGGQIRR